MSIPENFDSQNSAGEDAADRLLKDLGISTDSYLSEETAPPVDSELLVALANRTLEEPKAREVCELMARYRSWNDAFLSVITSVEDNNE